MYGDPNNPGTVYVTTNAAAGGSATWTSVAGTITDPSTVACGSATMCMLFGGSGDAELLTESGSIWSAASVATGNTNGLSALSCPTATMCMAVGALASGSTATVLVASISGSSATITSDTGKSGIPTQSLTVVACDSANSCALFGQSVAAQTADGGNTFTPISGWSTNTASLAGSASCGGPSACYAVGSDRYAVSGLGIYSGNAFVLSTNGISSSAFLPTPLLPFESYGGPDGSRPCFSCALKAAGLSAQGFVAEPINTADGDFYESLPIVTIPGLGPNLSFTATYDSQLAQADVASGATSPGSLGWGWNDNASMSLSGTSGGGDITVNEEGGAQLTYTPVSSGLAYNGSACTTGGGTQCYASAQGDVTALLEEVPIFGLSFYLFSRNNGLTYDLFTASGQLDLISDANGTASPSPTGSPPGPTAQHQARPVTPRPTPKAGSSTSSTPPPPAWYPRSSTQPGGPGLSPTTPTTTSPVSPIPAAGWSPSATTRARPIPPWSTT